RFITNRWCAVAPLLAADAAALSKAMFVADRQPEPDSALETGNENDNEDVKTTCTVDNKQLDEVPGNGKQHSVTDTIAAAEEAEAALQRSRHGGFIHREYFAMLSRAAAFGIDKAFPIQKQRLNQRTRLDTVRAIGIASAVLPMTAARCARM